MNIKYLYIAVVVFLLGTIGYIVYKNNPLQDSKTVQQQSLDNNGNGRGSLSGQSRGTPNSPQSRRNCIADGCLAIDELTYPAGKLSDTAKTSLNKALDDEYKAQATYEAIMAKFGNIRPFIMIIRAEEQHISSLKALFDKYGLEIPGNPYTGKITSPQTLSEACTAGVDAEIANASLYKDELLPSVTEYEDITLVFTNLMNASQEKHLPAFQRCAE